MLLSKHYSGDLMLAYVICMCAGSIQYGCVSIVSVYGLPMDPTFPEPLSFGVLTIIIMWFIEGEIFIFIYILICSCYEMKMKKANISREEIISFHFYSICSGSYILFACYGSIVQGS